MDEVCVSLVPVLFGEGIPYFTKLDGGHQLLDDPIVIQGAVPFTCDTQSDVRPRCSDAAVDRPPGIITAATTTSRPPDRWHLRLG